MLEIGAARIFRRQMRFDRSGARICSSAASSASGNELPRLSDVSQLGVANVHATIAAVASAASAGRLVDAAAHGTPSRIQMAASASPRHDQRDAIRTTSSRIRPC